MTDGYIWTTCPNCGRRIGTNAQERAAVHEHPVCDAFHNAMTKIEGHELQPDAMALDPITGKLRPIPKA